jgi:hypothetical protein
MIYHDICLGLDIVISFNTAIQVDDDGSRPDALLRDRLPGWNMWWYVCSVETLHDLAFMITSPTYYIHLSIYLYIYPKYATLTCSGRSLCNSIQGRAGDILGRCEGWTPDPFDIFGAAMGSQIGNAAVFCFSIRTAASVPLTLRKAIALAYVSCLHCFSSTRSFSETAVFGVREKHVDPPSPIPFTSVRQCVFQSDLGHAYFEVKGWFCIDFFSTARGLLLLEGFCCCRMIVRHSETMWEVTTVETVLRYRKANVADVSCDKSIIYRYISI